MPEPYGEAQSFSRTSRAMMSLNDGARQAEGALHGR
jgi:hypothetical protein